MVRCHFCEKFFSRFRCNAPDECDCPKCQGMCECGKDETEVMFCPECGSVRPKGNDSAFCIPCANTGHLYTLITPGKMVAKIERLKGDGYAAKARLCKAILRKVREAR